MKPTPLLGSLLLFVMLLSSACATITYDATMLENTASMTDAMVEGPYEHITAFEVEHRSVFLIASLITLVDSEIEEILAREMRRHNGNAVVNLQIEEIQNAIDVLIGLLQPMGGLIETRTIRLRGDIIRITEDPPVDISHAPVD